MAIYIDINTGNYPVSENDIRLKNPQISFSDKFNPPSNYSIVFPSPIPVFDPITEVVLEEKPELTEKGHYEQKWAVTKLSNKQILDNQNTKQELDARKKAENISKLWEAAYNFEYSRITGMAVGVLTLGVLQKKPKALAIKEWSKSLWALYYTRKELITPNLDETLLDFSSIGEMPFSIPELVSEVGV